MVFLPPHRHGAAAIGIQNDLLGPVAGFANPVFVWQAQLYPEFDVIGQGFLPQLRFVIGAQAFGKLQRICGVQGKGQQPDHHSLVGF